MRNGMTLLVVLALFAACADSEPETASVEQLARVCASGPTLKGMDVSFYQGDIDWAKVKADGIAFAFVRVSDGLANIDSKFSRNWNGARANGILRGAYQYFRPNLDATAQARLFLDKVGTMAPDDLPPVIDVEATGSQSAATIAAKVKIWIDIVSKATGKTPIIYTGFYFWRDSVGNASFVNNPLWVAAYVTHCPDIPSVWPSWAFWQTTDKGAVAGIANGVDMNTFNGDKAALLKLTGVAATCGDNKCEGTETTETCSVDCPPCGVIAATGGTVDDGDSCFVGGGSPQFLRNVTTAGNDGDLVWTYATDAAAEGNSGQWNLYFADAGTYRVEVFTDATFAKSKKASYRIRARGADGAPVVIDQTAVNGWQSLGDVTFAAGGSQFIHVGDNTGEPSANKVQLAFDSVRLTRLDLTVDPPPDEVTTSNKGCSSSQPGSTGLFVLLALVALVRPRSRRSIVS
jgi:GH25 family lysozyme M1 (1,4-beta-N-acetylmuramidase)